MSDIQASYNNAINELFQVRPEEVHNIDNISYMYYSNQLYLKLASLYKFNNLPATYDIDYLKDNLFRTGYLCAVKKDGLPYLLIGGITGINAYDKPTGVNIANPVLGNWRATIGEDAELLYFNRIKGFYRPVEPIIRRYATLLAQCDASLNTTLMNSRIAQIFIGETDAEVKSYQKMYDEVSGGKPAIFLKKGKDLKLDGKENKILFNDVKNTYVGKELLETKRSIMSEFLCEIGIPNVNFEKSERLLTNEVDANNTETKAIAQSWLETMQECCARINSTFGLSISVEFNPELVKEGLSKTTNRKEDEYELD